MDRPAFFQRPLLGIYPRKDPRGRYSFAMLVDQHCPGNGALRELAGIVNSADFPGVRCSVPLYPWIVT
jgi:hypothetical protein